MINHFNAFISYKHAELDNKIAASIVRDLERFHIPHKIRKATGFKKIERIFRDKDELPITSDLGDTISQALQNADYLIVICSHNTKKSTWVEREIEYFLESHPIDHVLTVLCEGEPSEVIPKVLLSGKRTFTDENGDVHTQEIPFEPLSCDYRMPYRRAKAEELPRLAAAIIGCSYDELINRQRQYRMRRLTAVFAGAMALTLGFAGYMFYSNTLIQKNYLESLKNQSRYLANESEKLLENEKRIDAMQLALEALPKDEEDERPVTPEAVRAISKASMSYVSIEGSNIGAVWNYKMPGHVSSFKLSEGGSYFAAMDRNGVVAAWDTKTHKQVLYDDNPGDKPEGFFFFGDDRLIVLCNRSVSVFDLTDGSRIWRTEDNDFHLIYVDDVFEYSKDSILLPDSNGYADVLSMKDGSVLDSFRVIDESEMPDLVLKQFAFSKENNKLIFNKVDRSDFNNYKYSLCVYDIGEKELKESDELESRISSLSIAGDNIFAAFKDDGTDGSVQMFDYNFVTESHTDIKCFSQNDLENKWSVDFAASDVYMDAGFLPMETGDVAYFEADTCMVMNEETGEILGTYKANDPIVDISDRDKDGEPLFITNGGASGTPATVGESRGVSLISRFSDDLADAIVGNGVYTLSDMASEVIYYGTRVYDEDWQLIEDVPDFKVGNHYCLEEDVLAVLADDGDGTKLLLMDPGEKKYLGEASLSDSIASYRYRLLGSFDGSFYTAVVDDSVFNVIKTDMECEVITLNDNYGKFEPVCVLENDKLVYVDTLDFFEYCAVQRNISTGEEKRVEFSDSFEDLYYFDETGKAYITAETDILIDFADESVTEISAGSDKDETLCVSMDAESETLAVANADVIRLIGKDGTDCGEISCKNVSPLSVGFITAAGRKMLIAAFQNGTLIRYDAVTFEFIGKSDLSVYASSYLFDTVFEYDSESGLLYVKCGDICDVIETESWIELTRVFSCFGHDKKTDTFLTYGYENRSEEGVVGYFEHYSVERLIQKTRDYLQGEEMSEDQKSMYGISG